MPFKAQAEISQKIEETLSKVQLKMPNGDIPHKEALADLKGILPNPKTIKNVLACGTGVPTNFLADFDPLTSLVANIPIPKPKFPIKNPIIDVVNKEPEPLPEINTEGLTEKEIAELERKREAQQKINELKTEASNKLKGAAAGVVNKIGSEIQNQLQGGVEGAIRNAATGVLAGAMGAPGVRDIMLKVAAFKFFKAQIASAGEKVKIVQEEAKKTMEEAKENLKGQTESIEEDKKLAKENKEKEQEASKKEAKTDTYKSKSRSGGPEAGSKHNSKDTRETQTLRQKADGFKANLDQTVKNVGSFLNNILGTIKQLLGTILKVVGALLAMIGLINMLKQLMELMMMLMFGKCNGGISGGAANTSQAQSPEQFLEEIGYPGFTQDDFSTALANAFDTQPAITLPTFTNDDLYNPIIIGGIQIGQPLMPGDLDTKDFNNHPIMGDLTGIHPQIINDLYNDGVLPLPGDVKIPDPNQFEKGVDELYDQIFDELVESQNIEYIEKLYNLDFEMVGYKRYYDRA